MGKGGEGDFFEKLQVFASDGTFGLKLKRGEAEEVREMDVGGGLELSDSDLSPNSH